MILDQNERALLRSRLIGALIGLARATEGNAHMMNDSAAAVTVEGLLAVRGDAATDAPQLRLLLTRAEEEKRKLVPSCFQCAAPCGRTDDYDLARLEHADAPVRSLKMQILTHACDLAVRQDEKTYPFLYKALYAIGMDDWDVRLLQCIVQEAEEMKK